MVKVGNTIGVSGFNQNIVQNQDIDKQSQVRNLLSKKYAIEENIESAHGIVQSIESEKIQWEMELEVCHAGRFY